MYGRDAAKVVIYCIKYSEVLQGLIQELGPDTDEEVKSFQRQGQEPIFIGILETDIFDEFMSRVRPRIRLPKGHLDSDKVRLLVLCERGFIWQQTTPIVNAMSLS